MANILVVPRIFEAELAIRNDVVGNLPPGVPANSFPTALRWRVHPDLGFPRAPFKVFRRPFTTDANRAPLNQGSTNVTGSAIIEWGRIPAMQVDLTASPSAGSSLTLQALDERGDIILGETVTVNSVKNVRLRTPNICALQVTGNGTVSSLSGFTMTVFVNSPGWELIEITGLPVEKEQAPDAVYNCDLQGHPATLKSGIEAARDRLNIGAALYVGPAATDPSGKPAPSWPAPPVQQVIDEVAKGDESPIAMILEMLGKVDPVSLAGTQAGFRREFRGTGLRQPGGPIPSDTAANRVRLASMMLLSAAVDSWTALALGFGTTDFPTQLIGPVSGVVVAPREPAPAFDYMITADYELPGGLKATLAACAAPPRFKVQPPVPLTASTLRRHRPLNLDGPAGADISLNWTRLPRQAPPQGYAFAIRQGGAAPEVLNQPRQGVGFVPYIPARRPDGDLANEITAFYVDQYRQQPIAGTRADTYLAAGTDVFGRWSTWSTVDNTAMPDPPATPRILDTKFQLNVSAATGHSIPADITVDFLWDWQDRTPAKFEFAGSFFPGTTPPVSPPAGFQRTPTGPAGSTIVVTIPAAGPIVVAGGGSAVQLPAESGDGDNRRYRLTVPNVTADFTSTSRLRYVLFARASEAVNPSLFSPFTAPSATEAIDPLPPSVPVTAPDIHWAALPDASGIARARIKFPPASFAAGYVVYEARESGIRTAAGLPAAPNDTLLQRAVAVAAAAEATAAKDAFTRVNTKLLPSAEAEVEVPGTSTSFFVYKVAAMSAEQVESPLSRGVLVAVPRRITPGTPTIRARVDPATSGVRIAVEPGPGSPPAGIALFRVNATNPPPFVDYMGPAIVEPADSRWHFFNGAFNLSDVVEPSWRPYYYRAVAVGPDDPANGTRSGRSKAAGPVSVFVPPTNPPELRDLVVSSIDDTLLQVTFISRAEVTKSPAGVHRVQLFSIDDPEGRPVESVLAEAELPAIGKLTSPEPPQTPGVILRGERDGAGRYLYVAVVNRAGKDLLVRMTDPASRSTELRAPMPAAPAEPPDLANLTASIVRGKPSSKLTISVQSSAPIKPMDKGAYVLEFIGTGPGVRTVLARSELNTIQTAPQTGQLFRSGPGPDRRFTYSLVLTSLPSSVNSVTARLTDPDGLKTELSVSLQ